MLQGPVTVLQIDTISISHHSLLSSQRTSDPIAGVIDYSSAGGIGYHLLNTKFGSYFRFNSLSRG
jgi:hypothetical protein